MQINDSDLKASHIYIILNSEGWGGGWTGVFYKKFYISYQKLVYDNLIQFSLKDFDFHQGKF